MFPIVLQVRGGNLNENRGPLFFFFLISFAVIIQFDAFCLLLTNSLCIAFVVDVDGYALLST